MVEHGRGGAKDIILFALKYRDADGRDSRVDVGGSRSLQKNGDRLSVKERRAANHPHQKSRARCPEAKSQVRSLKSDYVFPSDTFTLLDDSHLRRAFRGAMKLCRIENFHFHDLRHTFATRLVQAGIDLPPISQTPP